MLTQRENDISRLEAQMFVRKLFDEWLMAYLGSRAQAQPQEVPELQPEAVPVPGPELGG